MKLLNGDQRGEIDLAFCTEIFRDSEIFQTESMPTWFKHTLRLPADVRFTIKIWIDTTTFTTNSLISFVGLRK